MKTLSDRRSPWHVCLPMFASAWLALALPVIAAERGPVQRPHAAMTPGPAAGTEAETETETEARVIVKFKAGSSLMRALSAGSKQAYPQEAQAMAARLGLSLRDGRVIGARMQVLRAQGLSSKALADRLSAQSDVEYAVADGRMRIRGVPNDPLYPDSSGASPASGQWYLRPPTSATIVDANSILSAINTQAAWDITNGRREVVVAVLDTGVRLDHPDLAGKLVPGYDFIHEALTANDGNGRDADPSDPGDFVTAADVGTVPGCTSADIGDSTWHGTQTAGLTGAATNNGVGMAGAGRDVMVLPVRVLGKCGGYDSDIQAALLWTAGISAVPGVNPTPAKVVNLSLGSSAACSTAYRDVLAQLNAAGVVVVAAAGNQGLAVGSPAICPGVIAVAGVRHAGTKVGYSDLGPEISIAAPAGNCVNTTGACLFPLLTTSNSGSTTPVAGAAGAIYTDGNASASLGTSFAAPLVSGTIGLMLSTNPALTPAQVLAALKSTARAFPATGAAAGVSACTAPTSVAQDRECYCTTSTCGAGLLDAGAAVASVAAVTANIGVASTTVAPGDAVTLDGSGSSARTTTGTIVAYEWTITSGAGIASFTTATNAATAVLQTTVPGTVVVALTVTDSTGGEASTSVTLNVADPAAPAPAASAGVPPPGSSGGGSTDPLWLIGGAVLVVVARIKQRRRNGAPTMAG